MSSIDSTKTWYSMDLLIMKVEIEGEALWMDTNEMKMFDATQEYGLFA